MKLNIYGNKKEGFRAHGESNGEVHLENCPFCGSGNIEVSNTHTPSYRGRCEACDAEGPRPEYPKRQATTREAIQRQHRKAYAQAVTLWNARRS